MEISVIIPTYNEGDNVWLLTEQLKKVLTPVQRSFEVLFVDDSTDDTPDRLESLTRRYDFVRFIHREGQRGLATAVVKGLELARGRILIVMDADSQHPADVIPGMIEQIDAGSDMVIPSRFIPGGDDGGLNLYRKWVSWTARMMARAALKRVRRITDPTSGFFAVRKETIAGKQLNPIGWKIMLEIIVQADIQKIVEIPYHFKARDLGSSKMSMMEQLKYVAHLAKLVLRSDEDSRFYKFCLVGLSGVAVNLVFYELFIALGAKVIAAFLLSSAISIISNFLLNNRFTWRRGQSGRFMPFSRRFLKYAAVSSAGLAISSGLVSIFYYWFHISSTLSGIIGIVGSVVWNFIVNDKWTFSKKRASTTHQKAEDGTAKNVKVEIK